VIIKVDDLLVSGLLGLVGRLNFTTVLACAVLVELLKRVFIEIDGASAGQIVWSLLHVVPVSPLRSRAASTTTMRRDLIKCLLCAAVDVNGADQMVELLRLEQLVDPAVLVRLSLGVTLILQD